MFEKHSDNELFLRHNAPLQSTLITAAVSQKYSSQCGPTPSTIIGVQNNQQQHSQLGHNRRTNSQEVFLVCQLCDRPGNSTRICCSQSHNHFQERDKIAGQQMQQ